MQKSTKLDIHSVRANGGKATAAQRTKLADRFNVRLKGERNETKKSKQKTVIIVSVLLSC